MKRRQFIKNIGALTGLTVLPKLTFAQSNSAFSGKFLVTVEAAGGWDVSAFCDPKMNVPGEAIINHWAENGETQTVGNINYAPFANNAAFFDKYYRDMMVINGIDSQTNSHTTGVINVWSGRLSSGYPTISSLYAAHQQLDIPIPYISNAGYRETGGIIRSTLLDNPYSMLQLSQPNIAWIEDPNSKMLQSDDLSALEAAQNSRLQRLLSETNTTAQKLRSRNNLQQARSAAGQVENFTQIIQSADYLEPAKSNSNLNQQAQLAVMAFASGVAIAADLTVGTGFDTHALNDQRQEPGLNNLVEGIDKLYHYAEQYGIADRMVVIIGSEFSRTPYYNDEDGKDHWPSGSMIIMERNAPWTNRVVGYTDEGQFAAKINPSTLQVDEFNGSYIYPKHIMLALRNYLGMDGDINTEKFAFPNTELFDVFNPNLSTPQLQESRNSVRF